MPLIPLTIDRSTQRQRDRDAAKICIDRLIGTTIGPRQMLTLKRLFVHTAFVIAMIFVSPVYGPAQALKLNELPLMRYLVRGKLDSSQSRLVVLVDALSEGKGVTVDSAGAIEFPVGGKPRSIELQKVRFFTLDGFEVPLKKVRDPLKTIRPIFFFDNFAGEVVPLTSEYARLLGDQCWIVVTSLSVRPK